MDDLPLYLIVIVPLAPLFHKHVNMGKWNGANYMIKLVKRLTGAGTMKPDMRFCMV